jgi:hypothetical protein
MPDAVRNPPHRRPKWAEALYHEMQTTIGWQLKAQYELPRELPPDIAMLLMRMDEPCGTV